MFACRVLTTRWPCRCRCFQVAFVADLNGRLGRNLTVSNGEWSVSSDIPTAQACAERCSKTHTQGKWSKAVEQGCLAAARCVLAPCALPDGTMCAVAPCGQIGPNTTAGPPPSRIKGGGLRAALSDRCTLAASLTSAAAAGSFAAVADGGASPHRVPVRRVLVHRSDGD